mmetsp:Transcript_93696/g.293078  ORF Transcript_93696/g.293078 Transcript_93696/m.293078 type:complete len:220 (+) Transcript_93696:113-772(+)
MDLPVHVGKFFAACAQGDKSQKETTRNTHAERDTLRKSAGARLHECAQCATILARPVQGEGTPRDVHSPRHRSGCSPATPSDIPPCQQAHMPASPQGNGATKGRHAIDRAGSSRQLGSAVCAAEDPRGGGSPGRLLVSLLEACIAVLGALAADHADGVDDPGNVAQCGEYQADAELQTATEAPEDAERRQEVGTHQGDHLVAEPIGAHVRTGGGNACRY